MTQLTTLQVEKLETVLNSRINKEVDIAIANVRNSEEYAVAKLEVMNSQEYKDFEVRQANYILQKRKVNEAITAFATALKAAGYADIDSKADVRVETVTGDNLYLSFHNRTETYLEQELNNFIKDKADAKLGLYKKGSINLLWQLADILKEEASARLSLFPYTSFDVIIDTIMEEIDVETSSEILREENIAHNSK